MGRWLAELESDVNDAAPDFSPGLGIVFDEETGEFVALAPGDPRAPLVG